MPRAQGRSAAARIKPAIVLDTSAIWNDVYLNKGALTAVIDAAGRGDYLVVVPEVVVRELVAQFPRRLRTAVQEVNKAVGKATPEFRRLSLDLPSPLEVDEALVSSYETALRERLSSDNVEVAPIPTEMATAINWAIEGRKPFKGDGAGIQDAAIWLTTLEVAALHDQTILVTRNTSDFMEADQPTQLAPDLRRDLESRGIDPGSVRVLSTIDDLVSIVSSPPVAAEERARQLLADPSTRLALIDRIEARLTYVPLPQRIIDIGIDLVGEPQSLETAVHDVVLESARDLQDGRLLMRLGVLADMVVAIRVNRDDIDYAIRHRLTSEFDDTDLPVAEGEARTAANLTLDVTIGDDIADPDVELLDANPLDDEDFVELLLETDLGEEVFESLARGSVPDVSPFHPFDDEMEAGPGAVLAFRPESIELISVDNVTIEGFECTVRAIGDADVSWTIPAPSAFDLAAHPDHVQGDLAAGPWLEGIAISIRISVDVALNINAAGYFYSAEVVSAAEHRV